MAAIVLAIMLAEKQEPSEWKLHIISNNTGGPDGVRLEDVNGDGFIDVVSAHEQSERIYAFLHPGIDKLIVPWPEVRVGTIGRGEDAFFADLNNDGAIDVFSSHEGSVQGLFVHWAPIDPAAYLDRDQWVTERIEIADGNRWMFSIPVDVNQDGRIDIVSGSRTNSVAGILAWLEYPTPDRPEWLLHNIGPAGWPMSMHAIDMDEDGDLDILLSDRQLNPETKGVRWVENSVNEGFDQWVSHFVADLEGREAMFMDVADLDSNGSLDVVVPINYPGGSEISLANLLSDERASLLVIDESILTDSVIKAAGIADLDLDGINEIVITSEKGDLGIGYFRSASGSFLEKWTWVPIFDSLVHAKYDLVAFADVDHDGDLDIITSEERQGLGVIWLENPALSR
jgi:hypothetical protein